MQIDPPPASDLTGAELFAGLDASVIDFWQFAMSDLRTNNVRGYLAEFLIARAVGSVGRRVEWDPWDVTAPDGTRVEVKSSAYLQAWGQKRLSRPTFRVAPAYGWNEATSEWTLDQRFHADAYVFCLHTATTHDDYDPLDVSQWEFYVASRDVIEKRSGASMGVATLAQVAAGPVAYSDLRLSITEAGESSRRSREG